MADDTQPAEGFRDAALRNLLRHFQLGQSVSEAGREDFRNLAGDTAVLGGKLLGVTPEQTQRFLPWSMTDPHEGRERHRALIDALMLKR